MMAAITIIIIGFSGLIAQVSILRELLISCFGNELILGIILSNWILSEAVGAFLAGKFSERIKDKFSLLILLQLIFILAFKGARQI